MSYLSTYDVINFINLPGRGSKPLGGYKNGADGGDSWVPLGDGQNSWVKVDDGDASCVKYNHLHPGPPEWGVSGEGNEGMTRNIVCCADVVTTAEPTAKPTPKPTNKPTSKPTPQPTKVSLSFGKLASPNNNFGVSVYLKYVMFTHLIHIPHN